MTLTIKIWMEYFVTFTYFDYCILSNYIEKTY
jgi:hypothetical protein